MAFSTHAPSSPTSIVHCAADVSACTARRRRPRGLRGGWLLVTLALAGTMACGGEPPPPPESYTTRGVVRQVGMGPQAPSEVLIHHEAIPSFRDDRGETVGMEAMAMPFKVADMALTEGLEPGDRIDFDFEVRWEGGPPLQLTRLDKLDPSVQLDFETTEAPADAGGEDVEGASAEEEGAEGEGADSETPDADAPTDGSSDHANHGP